MKKKITVLTWMATKNDPGALKSLLSHLKEKHEIAEVLYIYQKDLIDSDEDATEKFEAAKKVYPLTTIGVHVKDPTNHQEIYDIVNDKIVPMVQNETNLVINISSGTPAMHSIWLLLFALEKFPDGTRLINSQIKRKKGETTCEDVKFSLPLKSLFTELRKYEKENPNKPIYKETKSKIRKKALENLKTYSEIPGVPILLLGERGTGKSRVVESHIASVKNKPVTALVCGSLDSTLLESKLFGHKAGSFTGAIKDVDGLLKTANNGILFLDEIQDMPKNVQRRLLQVIQDPEHHYRVLGATEESKTNIEIVCASNLPEKELRQRLDPDFYDRISFFKVTLPPLRECREDIHTDWQEVWTKTVRLESSPEEAPEDDMLMNYLKTSNLYGNFRSLQMIAYQLIAWRPWEGKKTIKEILEEIPPEEDVSDKNPDGVNLDEFSEMSWGSAVDRFQHMLAEYSCKKYGSQKKAAEKLDCTTKTLQLALKK
ncbi:sigma 54-interacting transcriptional regulator [uncultured Fibrobacter sp.]|uniref:sigma-54-dependent transcriptional regulator n=1 Tax=uncultured Fibrobacter sp. TaxID=261512 RepID=UPI0025D9ABB4|nr:sigma 54-interacting transcriptional regulator [uncultured Fibrobacter sp.]